MSHVDEETIRRLLAVGRELVAELDSEAVLERVLEEAQALTGARYAALGVLDEERSELERFVTSGIDAQQREHIGDLPHGRGVLGLLIEDPRPLRLRDVSEHPQSYGFPPGHPPMGSFLGVPVSIRGQAWGNLYLTDKEGADEFTDADEEAVIILARWAGTAIENARLYERSEHRRLELERAVRSLEASRDISYAIGSEAELEHVLELVVKRGRALVQACTVLIMLREGSELAVAATAGRGSSARGHRLPISASSSGQVLEQGRAARIADVATQLQVRPEELGVPGARTALLVPMLHRGTAIGVLAAFDRGEHAEPFTSEDAQLLGGFAAAAANAVVIKRSVQADRLRSAIEAADAERRRWARELHDQTLQSLGALRVLLASAERRGDPEGHRTAIRQAISDIEVEIENLRGIISDLRPSLLDDIGLRPALEALIDRRRGQGLEVEGVLDIADPGAGPTGLSDELETTVYRLVQEALTNVVKHAGARTVRVQVRSEDGSVRIEVQDDGEGFDPEVRSSGFGLAGMRERVYLAGGRLELESGAWGTRVRAELPVDGAPGDIRAQPLVDVSAAVGP